MVGESHVRGFEYQCHMQLTNVKNATEMPVKNLVRHLEAA